MALCAAGSYLALHLIGIGKTLSWVRIVIVNYNSGPWLARCLQSLQQQSFGDFEVVVIDNQSTDDSAAVAMPDARFSLRRMDANLGFAAGCNVGAAGSTAPWLIMLNPDTTAEPDWLAELRAATERNPDVAMFGSTQLMMDDPNVFDGCGDALSFLGVAWRMGYGQPFVRQPDRAVFAPCAAAALYSRVAFEAAGGFDEDFFCYIEDVDLAFRLRLMGHRCLQVAAARVNHAGSWSTGRYSPFSLYHSYRNRIWMLFQDLPAVLLVPLLPMHLAVLAYLLLRPNRLQPIMPRLSGTYAGLAGLPGRWRRRQAVQAQRRITLGAVCRALSWQMNDMRKRRIISVPGEAVGGRLGQ